MMHPHPDPDAVSWLGKRIRVVGTDFEGEVLGVLNDGQNTHNGPEYIVFTVARLDGIEGKRPTTRPDPLHALLSMLELDVGSLRLDDQVKSAIEMSDHEALGAAASTPSAFTRSLNLAHAIDMEREKRGIEPFRARDLKSHTGDIR